MLFPALDLWDFIDADCCGVVLEDGEFFMVQDPLSRLFCKSDDAVSFVFAILAQSLDFMAVDTTISVLTALPEGSKTDNDLGDLPDWIPRLWMVVGNRKADTLFPGMESSILSFYNNFWSLSWVLWWANDFAHVETSFVFFVVKSENDVVPGVAVFWVWQ